MDRAQNIAESERDIVEGATGKAVDKSVVINKINFIHFKNGTLAAVFSDTRYGTTVSYNVKPSPCSTHLLQCSWVEGTRTPVGSSFLKFSHLIIPDPLKILHIEAELIAVDEEGFTAHLPQTATERNSRKLQRHVANEVSVELIQSAVRFDGRLIDFTSESLKIEVTARPPATFEWIVDDAPVTTILKIHNESIFSGQCRIIKHGGNRQRRTYVLELLHKNIQRFKKKEFRTRRCELIPSPTAYFAHPFTRKKMSLRVQDISGTGFSIEEDTATSVLVPGMILPAVELNIANSLRLKCSAQVLYRTESPSRQDHVRFGLSVIDMAARDHVTLQTLLQQASDRNAYICNEVDMDDLWNFFFETGFIYPKKYQQMSLSREKYRNTYEKLYLENPQIARHFIYQEDGRIMAHMSMIRFFQNAWLIHHHAARKSHSLLAGISVLGQISRYISELHTLSSANLNYVYCYFRPDNKFPQRIFGGVARTLRNQNACSLDTFAYFRLPEDSAPALHDPEWELLTASEHDQEELRHFYAHHSAGLMIDAFDMGEEGDPGAIKTEFENAGLRREKRLFTIKKKKELKAFIVATQSEEGLNLSDLTNALHVFVLDETELSREILLRGLQSIRRMMGKQEMPVLAYPVSYIQKAEINYDKLYSLWILNLDYSDGYMKFCKSIFKRF